MLATSRKSNQLPNINTVRWESRNIATQPGEINDRTSKVIAFVVNAGVNIIAKAFIFKSRKEVAMSNFNTCALTNVVTRKVVTKSWKTVPTYRIFKVTLYCTT